MNKLRVAVVYGGPSREYEISIRSGESILNHIDNNTYDVSKILLSEQGEWLIDNISYNQSEALKQLKQRFDFVLLALHGTFGEDGTVQALLEEAQIAYSGSHSHASQLAMNKHETSKLYHDAGFVTPKEVLVSSGYKQKGHDDLLDFAMPVIVKPLAQGSSFGVSKVTERGGLEAAIDDALQHDRSVLVQEYIDGREVSAGVIENELGELVALPPTELIPTEADFFDFDAKYTEGGAAEITPPDLPEELIDEIKRLALAAHRVIGCCGYSRTDMIIRDRSIYLIETNTLPGMTDLSILPQEAAAAGISYTKLIDLIIQSGLRNSVYN